MTKKNNKAEKMATNPERKQNVVIDSTATDNQNANQNHNTTKEAMGPNTRR